MHAQPPTASISLPRVRSNAASAVLAIGGWIGAFAILGVTALLVLVAAALVFGSALLSTL